MKSGDVFSLFAYPETGVLNQLTRKNMDIECVNLNVIVSSQQYNRYMFHIR